MRTTTRRAVLCAPGVAAALSGCAAVTDALPGVPLSCTALGNAEYHPAGDVAVDLDGEPITVDVVVRDETGAEVYTAHGTATPTLFQPDGAACDRESYHLSLLATTSGALVRLPFPSDAPRLDARGRESVAISTACGLDRIDLPDGTWSRVSGTLGDGLLWTDDAGHRETFR